ncbi:hypothetical protein SLEP1_g24581 [Rubroshorea leprosula]|uniref:Uncharacterized protein n=1 Tax=Rubroshorea leprosula TaxID=152421 RepID=A0AAV5JRM8_9ROSI|nr:hypothetical protein SLEP1_g24581 [Rubroshorea leprosula]
MPPPLSPILGEHSFLNPTFNKDSEFGDDVAQSGDSLVKAVSDQISIMRHTLLEYEEKAQQRSQEVARQLDESFQNLAQNLAQSVAQSVADIIEPQPPPTDLQRQNQNILASTLGGQGNLPQPPPQIQQVTVEPVQPDPVEAAPRAVDLGNHQQPIYMPPPRRPNGGHPQHNATLLREHFQPYVPPMQQNLQDKIDKGILHFPDNAKETMGVDADLFPTMSVGMNAADLRIIARDRTQSYSRCRHVADDLRWVIEEAKACRN